ncbi:MAG: hypothetical protein UR80_C0025G0004 [Parcubacteria group bacterium GW2011_GWB1_35_5]|nr:MAG: hypothetical protein UR50_C0005G0046 [Parcubacteria group bacterium GW2011_GWC1_34_10]KKP80591.1 MAG: hypothetical protein UR80_C0025G0004 [Parcubacteria group bacterium GW2011_GWB1_35_5]OHA86653.1 MAG: hypothetical protein A2726_02230 [Candidatus Zambryskibacteria bacterium RIFCSPHIGHO2_01_FULL_35_32]
MFNISNFLEKFLKLDRDNILKQKVIVEIIKKETKIELEKENIEIKGEQIKIKTNPVIRNEIFMHKTEIEHQLKISKIFLRLI